MLMTYHIVLYSIVLFLLMPIVIIDLIRGSPVPNSPFFAKYYRNERYLALAGNLFLLTVGAHAATKLGQHFELISPATAEWLQSYINAPFFLMLVIFASLYVKAFLKVRKESLKTG